ncbi:MAG: WXG100 family type VII secretion target [Mycobacterium sp.]|nr:WXG100 family type VII secretion target [Mycobacterium sp.]
MALRVNIDDLSASGVAVTNHGEDLANTHAGADGRIEAAHAGWQGESATAMAARSAAWLETTKTLLTRMADHAQGLHTGAHAFAEMEAKNSEQMRKVAAHGDAAARAAKQ